MKIYVDISRLRSRPGSERYGLITTVCRGRTDKTLCEHGWSVPRGNMAKSSSLPKGHVHPYSRWEGTPLWKAIEKSIADLVVNQDLIEKEHREYIVGYICKIVDRRRTTIVAQLRSGAL
jgi:hypothetical protein